MRPATRVGNLIIFPSGLVITIGWFERVLFKLKIKRTATRPPSVFEIWGK